MAEPEPNGISVSEFAAVYQRFMQSVQIPKPPLMRRLREHLGVDPPAHQQPAQSLGFVAWSKCSRVSSR
jgi:hypothetical protein